MSITAEMIASAIVLIASYVFIFMEFIHRTTAALIGATVMIAVGMMMGFYSEEAALTAIDGNTVFLLIAMMLVIAMLRPTGIFEYLAIRIAQISRNDPRLLLLYLSLAVSLISMVLDNVTTVIVFAPLTILISRMLCLNPLPFLIAEAMLSNIGGAATLVGDPPNIMIGSAGAIDFNRFLIHMAPPVVVIWLSTVAMLLWMFRKSLTAKACAELKLHHGKAIQNRKSLAYMLLALGVIVALFFTHHSLHIYPAFAAFIGLSLALLLLRPKPDELFGSVNWSVLAFFCGLFVIVGGVKASGLLNLIGGELGTLAREPGMLLITGLLLMWLAAVLSAIVDNIPFTVTMIPIILGLESQGVNITPLWWALALGVGLGGNATHIGATANLIVVSESERCGIDNARITPTTWMRHGIPATFVSLLMASGLYALFFDFFS